MGQRKKIIAVCGAQVYEEKEYSFISRLNQFCRGKGYAVMIFNLSTDPLKHDDEIMNEKSLVEMISKFPIDALVILGETIKTPRMRELIKASADGMNIPVFAMDRYIEGCINIASKFGDGFKNMLSHVIDHHGCRKINMIAGFLGNDFSEERIEAYKQALAEHDIPFEPERLAYGDFWDRPAREATARFIESGDIPDAIVCANDTMAIAACAVLKEAGYQVPGDVIVTGFDGIMSGMLNFPPISTVAPDYDKEVCVLLELMEQWEAGNKPDYGKTISIDYIVRENSSCGCGDADDSSTKELINKLSFAFNDQKWQVSAMNSMMLAAADKQHLQELTPLLEYSVEMWVNYFYFIGVRSELVNYPDYYSGSGFTTLLRMEHGQPLKVGDSYERNIAIPDFERLLEEDNGYDLFMLRLLFTDSEIYGYLMEGFNGIDMRSMRRCDEFGMFVSTVISEILKNGKLFWFNEKLRQMNQEMEQAAIHDHLTGLYNRRGFFDELARITKASIGRYISLFSVDMDGLKYINDNFGHNEGDIAISAMAEAIRNFSARNGICARFGGDEFVCALITDQPIYLSPDTARNRLENTLSRRKDISAKPYSISASIGQECVKIDSFPDFDQVLKKADEAMYLDKHARKKERTN
ncbi:MAG: GGDEF domain-containing protein [Lachnospiraceae bacterium]|nr:GGDEF domain-containing protein [Lachnospiraceae bacterium]